jgi:hypothetical protein
MFTLMKMTAITSSTRMTIMPTSPVLATILVRSWLSTAANELQELGAKIATTD